MTQKLSLRDAINNHCRWCIWDKHAAGNWRQQVTACQITRCHLHPVRPLSRGRGADGPAVEEESEGERQVGREFGITL